MTINRWHGAAALCAFITWMTPAPAAAQVSEPVYQGLLKIGQIVDPACPQFVGNPLLDGRAR